MFGGKQLPMGMIGGKQLPPNIGGKQLPPTISSGKQLPPTPTPSDSQFSETSTASTPYWRIRKSADDLVESRRNIVRAHATNSDGVLQTTQTDVDDMPLSADWSSSGDLPALDARIAKIALDVAAQCVIDAIGKTSQEETTTPTQAGMENITNLPSSLKDQEDLVKLRHVCLERAHNNKEYAKTPKKKAKTAATPTKTKQNEATSAEIEAKEAPKKFTRNTPASGAAAMDARVTSSRVTLCAVAGLVFGQLTPGPEPEIDYGKANAGEAQTLSDRICHVVKNATWRSDMRRQFRQKVSEDNSLKLEEGWTDSEDEGEGEQMEIDTATKPDSITQVWKDFCCPRLKEILEQGAGHALLIEADWQTRHGRIADILRSGLNANRYGPHLIITVQPEVETFVREFERPASRWERLIKSETSSSDEMVPLSAIAYNGSVTHKCNLRRKYFSDANGLPYGACHVVVVSYSDLIGDFLQFCQVAWQAVVLDEGAASWMATAGQDPNSGLGQAWQALFSTSDHQVGLAGRVKEESNWNFTSSNFSESVMKDTWIGLTARHRILVSPSDRGPMNVAGLVEFILPQLIESIREEWDRSRITADSDSLEKLSKLCARATVVHSPTENNLDKAETSLLGLQGKLRGKASPQTSSDVPVPEIIQDGTFFVQNKIAFARRAALQALGSPEKSWIRLELGRADFTPLLEAMKVSTQYGHVCQEITTASSTTSSGATGQVAGSLAFRPAVRCCRAFGSEQGLRQHIAGLHAPPGTWLCRTCGVDCVTSQARTHHERTCGQPAAGSAGEQSAAGAIPTVGQGATKGSKKNTTRSPSTQNASGDKDSDGSVRVFGYQGVWINNSGKHFIKMNGERYKENKKLVAFTSVEAAAKRYDEIVCLTHDKSDPKILLNYKDDGSRNVYEDTAGSGGLGGTSSNVVPALSVINIQDLPPGVKPLLRDPRQTSRTGGNSKRHVYAYRGVCRQARKGHDRWQSQISFMGVNHYLGTFDSEWDAAAIYAWAHLILYGEEATKAAQKEGEEAAAAFEKEKQDIANGKQPAPTGKVEKKKKTTKKEDGDSNSGKRKRVAKEPTAEKKAKPVSKTEKDAIGIALAKAVGKAPILSLRDVFFEKPDNDLIHSASQHVASAIGVSYFDSDPQASYPAVNPSLRPCVQDLSAMGLGCVGGAILIGLKAAEVGWELKDFVDSRARLHGRDSDDVTRFLTSEYGTGGLNDRFQSVMQGTVCIIGSADLRTQRMYKSLGLGAVPIGGSVGSIDCHVGGLPGSSSEQAACIYYSREGGDSFHLVCLTEEDVVSINGDRLTPDLGAKRLKGDDIVTVGARVFVFALPD